jgi:hypothetical protein
VKEGVAACKARFWSDGEARRNPGDTQRRYEDTHDTFACRFYDRLAMRSPCEASAAMATFHVRLCDFDKNPIANAPFRIQQGTTSRTGTAEDDGFVTVQALKRPIKLRIEWTFPADADDPVFPFSNEYFVDVGDDGGADDRRLFNLGYVRDSQTENVKDYQRDFGHTPRSGKLDDIRTELRAFHDGGQRPAGRRS